MYIKGIVIASIFCLIISTSCGNNHHHENYSGQEYTSPSNDNEEDGAINDALPNNEVGTEEADDEEQIEDGTYTATVDYYNPNTGYSNTYTLDVEVENGEVVQIDFPNDGYLDECHIYPSEVDEDGSCHIEDEEGRSFDIQLDL